jgi:hypothetical protein
MLIFVGSYTSKLTRMNYFIDGLKMRFRKKGLSEIEINNKIRKYYYYSVAILLVYSLAAVAFVFLDRFKKNDAIVNFNFFLFFFVCIRIFLSLRKSTKEI